jgi:hypothetical protein
MSTFFLSQRNGRISWNRDSVGRIFGVGTVGIIWGKLFYVVIQIFEYYLTKFNSIFIFKLIYYFCNQEVEDESGSAWEQPVSNKLPVLRCNKFEGTVFVLSLFYLLQKTHYG